MIYPSVPLIKEETYAKTGELLGYGQQSPRVPVAPSRLASRGRGAQACDEPLSQRSY